MASATSFEHQRMRTTESAVEQAAATIRRTGKRLPNLVLSSHLEAKFAGWTVMLRDAGFGVCVSPSNPASTIPDAQRTLTEERIPILDRDPDAPPTAGFWAALSEFRPDLVFDDGALLIKAFNGRPLAGAVEFTTSGHDNLSGNGSTPAFPVFDVGLSYCKYELGNVYGTGVSALVAMSYSVNVNWAAKRVLIVGYGAVGRSVGNTARNLGAHVLVADSKVKNLARAHFDGHRVGGLDELMREAEIVVTCSGAAGALSAELLASLPDNAIVANVGCFANEIDVAGLRSAAERSVRRDRQIETFWLSSGKQIHILAGAELVNLSIGRGWPIELIDLCFALSTLCFAEVWTGDLKPGLHAVPPSLEETALSLFVGAR